MVVVKKSGKKAPLGGSSSTHDAENNSDLAAMRGTLEDYFNSKKAYQTDQMRELNKEVTKHLLTGEGDDNAMAMERRNSDADISTGGGASLSPMETGREAEAKDAKSGEDADAAADHKDHADDTAENEMPSEEGSGNEYEDDYESDSSVTAAADTSVAGMTLGDYLQAKGDGEFPLPTDEADHAESKRAAPKSDKLPQKPGKNPIPPAVVSGMSLDYYLGAKDTTGDDGEFSHHHSESTSPPKRKKLQPPHKSKTKSLLTALPVRQPPRSDYSSHDEFATPFQKRIKKQTKLKQQQQQHIQQGGAVAKLILLGDSSSSSQLLTATHLPASSSSSSQSKDKKKHGGAGSQPPLPKLLHASASSHAFAPAVSTHHRDDSDDNDYVSSVDDSADKKLPLLQPPHANHK